MNSHAIFHLHNLWDTIRRTCPKHFRQQSDQVTCNGTKAIAKDTDVMRETYCDRVTAPWPLDREVGKLWFRVIGC